jgi:hypothetical protein
LRKNGQLLGEPGDAPLFTAALKAAGDVAGKGNDVIHGLVVGFEEGPPQRIFLAYQDFDDPNTVPRVRAYTLSELEGIIPQLQQVHLFLAGLNMALAMDLVCRGIQPPLP